MVSLGPSSKVVFGALLLSCAAAFSSACAAVYPEVRTPVRQVRPDQPLRPPPPADLKWVQFRGARIPARTPGGQSWGNELSSGLPDPYAKLLVNDVEVLRTHVERGTLEPKWADSPAGNLRLKKGDRLRLEVWDARVLNDRPMGVRELGTVETDTVMDEQRLETSSGVVVYLTIEPAHPLFGYGFFYELRTYDVFVTRLYAESPAARAGLQPGDQILRINDRDVRSMTPAEIRSHLSVQTSAGVALALRRKDGSVASIRLVEGPIYPEKDELKTFR